MNKRRSSLAGAAAALLASIVFLSAAWAGALYVDREKVDVRKGMGSFFPVVYEARKGESLPVLGEQRGWYKVETPGGAGWVYGDALSETKPSGFGGAGGFAGTAETSELEKTAGAKGFDAVTEEAYVSQNNLQREMKLVDGLEKPPFTVAELKAFQKRGRVGLLSGVQP